MVQREADHKLSRTKRRRHYYLRGRLRQDRNYRLNDTSERVIYIKVGTEPNKYADSLRSEFNYELQLSIA